VRVAHARRLRVVRPPTSLKKWVRLAAGIFQTALKVTVPFRAAPRADVNLGAWTAEQHLRMPPAGGPSSYGARPGGSSRNDAGASEEPPRETAVVPTVLQWSQGGHSVYVTGSFNAWGERIPLRRSGNDCVVCLNLLPGTYQYKFIVDSEWRFAADQPTVRDEMGNINNCITVEDQSIFMREESPSGFFDNNANMYTQSLPDEITLAKEPPQAPSHLWCLPLNFSSLPEPHVAAVTLLPPLGVTVTHLHVMDTRETNTLAVTHRVRTKSVTIVFVKPANQAPPIGSAGASASGFGFGMAVPPDHGGFSNRAFELPALPQHGMDMSSRGQSHQSLMDVG